MEINASSKKEALLKLEAALFGKEVDMVNNLIVFGNINNKHKSQVVKTAIMCILAFYVLKMS